MSISFRNVKIHYFCQLLEIIIPFAKAPGVGGTPTPVYLLPRSSGLSSGTLGRITNSVFVILGEGRKEMAGLSFRYLSNYWDNDVLIMITDNFRGLNLE